MNFMMIIMVIGWRFGCAAVRAALTVSSLNPKDIDGHRLQLLGDFVGAQGLVVAENGVFGVELLAHSLVLLSRHALYIKVLEEYHAFVDNEVDIDSTLFEQGVHHSNADKLWAFGITSALSTLSKTTHAYDGWICGHRRPLGTRILVFQFCGRGQGFGVAELTERYR